MTIIISNFDIKNVTRQLEFLQGLTGIFTMQKYIKNLK